jgi:hypothetical protein
VAGFAGKYEVFPDGRIWNVHREKWQSQSDAGPYLKVHLHDGRAEHQLLVHRLVAMHFLPNPASAPIVNHQDGDKHHNAVGNLEWVSEERNAQHALELGLRGGYIPVPQKRALLHAVLTESATVLDLARHTGRRMETLHRMLRVQADKDGLTEQWQANAWKTRRKASMRNLAPLNVNALSPDDVARLFARALQGERLIDLAKEVDRHPGTIGPLLKAYGKANNIPTDFRRKRAA